MMSIAPSDRFLINPATENVTETKYDKLTVHNISENTVGLCDSRKLQGH